MIEGIRILDCAAVKEVKTTLLAKWVGCNPAFRLLGEGAFGDAELVLGAEVVPEGLAGLLAGEELLVGGEDFGGLGFVFFEELDAVAAEAGGVELGVEVGSGLGLVIEEEPWLPKIKSLCGVWFSGILSVTSIKQDEPRYSHTAGRSILGGMPFERASFFANGHS